MRRRMMGMLGLIAMLLCLCMLTTAAHALGEARTLTLGGGGDALTAIAVGADGRMLLTGYKARADAGGLAGRTGWALCVDARGRALWSFCAGSGAACEMTRPQLHADGSAQALLCEEADGEEHACLISLNAQGEETAREMLAQGRAAWAGRQTEESELSIEWPEGEDMRLLRRSEDGTYKPYVAVNDSAYGPDGEMRFCASGLVLLEDGGLAACGGQRSDGGTRAGRLIRWDAQGRRLFDTRVPGWALSAVLQTADGFAALARDAAQGETALSGPRDWRLIFLSDQGLPGETARLPRAPFARLAALPDGALAVLCADPYATVLSDAPRLVLID